MTSDWLSTPFKKRGEWSWPSKLNVRFDGDSALVRAEEELDEPPDLRAMMILEASRQAPHILDWNPVSKIRLELGSTWSQEAAEQIALRLGLFEPSLRVTIEFLHGGEPLPVIDVLADV